VALVNPLVFSSGISFRFTQECAITNWPEGVVRRGRKKAACDGSHAA
jgi:hypothetical protein